MATEPLGSVPTESVKDISALKHICPAQVQQVVHIQYTSVKKHHST